MKTSITVGILGVSLLLQSAALAQQQSKAQQKCINSLNTRMAKVASTQASANAKCIGGYARGKNNDAATCLATAPKVDKAQTRTCAIEPKRCKGPDPDFGYSSCVTVNSAAEAFTANLAADMFGFPVNNGILTYASSRTGFRCQTRVVRGVNKLYATHLKQFNRCKRLGLKAKTSPITSAAMLSTCVFADPKMRIAKAQSRLLTGIRKKCAATSNPLPGGDCAGLNDAALSICLEKRVRCAVCLTTRASDALTLDCDDFDDDVANGSCFTD